MDVGEMTQVQVSEPGLGYEQGVLRTDMGSSDGALCVCG